MSASSLWVSVGISMCRTPENSESWNSAGSEHRGLAGGKLGDQCVVMSVGAVHRCLEHLEMGIQAAEQSVSGMALAIGDLVKPGRDSVTD